jgi:uncharacterized NAD(P)/FAD-binding protein YdhS
MTVAEPGAGPGVVFAGRIAVIGAGAAGTIATIRLLERATALRVPVHVSLIDPGRGEGRGVAYATRDPRHRLNVPAGRMSANAGEPDEFRAWLENETGSPAGADDFAPREYFGAYLADCLRRAVMSNPFARLHRIRSTVVGLRKLAGSMSVRLADASALTVDAVVLAVGTFPHGQSWASAQLRGSDRFVADVWAHEAIAAVPASADVLLVGTGLTMIDLALSLPGHHRRIHAVSRHGLLPRPHSRCVSVRPPAPPEIAGLADLAAIRRAVRRHVGQHVRTGSTWQNAVDSVRPCTAALWAAMSMADRSRFIRQDRRRWDSYRHRLPPDTAARIAALRAQGELVVHTGQIATISHDRNELRVGLSSGELLSVGAVLNCTGPHENVREIEHPLLADLLASGLARPGPLDLGIDTGPDGRVLATNGALDNPLWTLGALRRGNLWETTAFAEIRSQAAQVADAVFALLARQPSSPGRSPAFVDLDLR